MKSGWKTKCFDDVLEIRNGKNQRAVESDQGKYPIYGSAGNVMGYATSYICEAGTTIIGRKGNINTPIYSETCFWNVDTAFGLVAKAELDKRFLYYFCLSYDFSLHNRGTTIPSLVKSDLLQIR
jgi:type I restriction enzyme S subunit